MAAHTPAEVPLAGNATMYENIKPMALDASRWHTMTGIKSIASFPDPQTGQVVSRAAVTNKEGILYIGTRLKVVDKKIAEVETSFNGRAISGVEATNVLTYDPVFDTIVPPEKRMTRASFERIVLAYFEALGTKKPDPADYDMRCDRFSSGNRVAHRGGGGRGMPPRWPKPRCRPGRCRRHPALAGDVGPGVADARVEARSMTKRPAVTATRMPGEHPRQSRRGLTRLSREFVVDPPSVVSAMGYTLLLYPNDREMLISEIFKVLDGRIRLVDYIGIVDTGVKTTGFPK